MRGVMWVAPLLLLAPVDICVRTSALTLQILLPSAGVSQPTKHKHTYTHNPPTCCDRRRARWWLLLLGWWWWTHLIIPPSSLIRRPRKHVTTATSTTTRAATMCCCVCCHGCRCICELRGWCWWAPLPDGLAQLSRPPQRIARLLNCLRLHQLQVLTLGQKLLQHLCVYMCSRERGGMGVCGMCVGCVCDVCVMCDVWREWQGREREREEKRQVRGGGGEGEHTEAQMPDTPLVEKQRMAREASWLLCAIPPPLPLSPPCSSHTTTHTHTHARLHTHILTAMGAPQPPTCRNMAAA